VKLTGLSKALLGLIVLGAGGLAVYKRWDRLGLARPGAPAATSATATAPPAPPAPARKGRLKAALSQWPGHMALVVGNGGLTTQPGSAAAALGLDLEIVFIEDAPSKNKALQKGEVDFVWQTVDELPINLGGYKATGVDVRAFVQIDWSRGGDACIASKEVRTVEDVLGRKAAMMSFCPDHTVFEFMLINSRLTREQAAQVRKDTSFSPDDWTFGSKLFTQGKVDVACLWEPDVTIALKGRPGAHRLFSTADATELVADVLLARKELLEGSPDLAEKVARTWFAGVAKAEADRPAAARLISTVASRFRDELGYEQTLAAFKWVKWTELSDNVSFFGLDGLPPAFDRVYNQADNIWINYPQAEIKDRFAPVALRDDRIVRRIWEASGKKPVVRQDKYEPAVAASGAAIFTKPVSINFRTNAAALDAESMAVVNQHVLPELEIARGMYIRVEGNTDNVGDEDLNRRLSERRAQSIVEYLISRGVDPARISAKGNGSSRPVASNRTAGGRARNRRTDVLFIPAGRGDG
jgi:outer membrane protein OmpA-like peptidoglycan-associated protein/ABC-type nitrate/sulfonate/bicarbonate transport system substrate-binding protein